MFDFEALSRAITGQTVLCVGDLMLDEFVYGEVSRISPEAPAPVIAVQRSEINIGGAGNVARNIASLGARCIFVGLIGDDDAGKTLRAALAQQSLLESVLICDPARPTTRKVRFVSEHFSTHMLRADWELAAPASAEIEQRLIDAILPRLPDADIGLAALHGDHRGRRFRRNPRHLAIDEFVEHEVADAQHGLAGHRMRQGVEIEHRNSLSLQGLSFAIRSQKILLHCLCAISVQVSGNDRAGRENL